MSCFSDVDDVIEIRNEKISTCVSVDQFDNCIPDYQGGMYVKSRYLGIWRRCHCRISGTKIFFTTKEMCTLTPANHVIRYVEFFNIFGLFNSKYRYIIHIVDGSRIVLSMKIDNEEDWGAWVLHLNLALSLSIKLQPASMLYSTNAVDFDGYFHRNAIEMMIQSFAITELIQGREKFRELQKLSSIYDSPKFIGVQEQKLRLAFELQCAKILVEILRSLVVSVPNEFEYAIDHIEDFHQEMSANELSNSNLLTSYIDDYCYQRIRQYMVSNLKTLGSIRSMSLDQSNIEDPAISPSSLSQSMKIVTTLSFAAVYLYNISIFISNISCINHQQGYLSYISPQSFGINRDIHFKNGDIMSCVIASYNPRIMTSSSRYVNFFVNILHRRYSSAIIACDDILGNNYIPIRYIRGWGALITAARSGNVKLFEYMLHRFILINPPKQWINWKELLINACGCNQNIALIELLLRKFETQRLITASEILILLISSLDANIEVVRHFLHIQYGSVAATIPSSSAITMISPTTSPSYEVNRFIPVTLARQSLLHIAVAGIRIDLVKLLYEWQPNQVSTEDIRGFYPLHVACCLCSSLDIIQFLYHKYPAALQLESFSVLDVYWPDLSYRCSLPIHLASSACLSVHIIKFLYHQHRIAAGHDHGSMIALTKYCLFRCVSQRQAFTSIRLDCIKFFIRKLKELTYHNHDASIATIDRSSPFSTPLSNHYTYLPPYEYMPVKTLNQQLVRTMYNHDISHDFRSFYDDMMNRQLNWDARKGAMLIRYHFYRRNHDDSHNVFNINSHMRIEDDSNTSYRAGEGVHLAERPSQDRSGWWRRWLPGRHHARTSNALMDIMSCNISGSSSLSRIALAREGIWMHVVQNDDIFRHCVSFL